MATAQQIVNRALRYINVADVSGDAELEYSTPALEDLNQMIDEWSNDNLIQTSLTEITHALVSGTYEYTIGASGDINTSWPVKIENVFVRDANNNDFYIEQINADQYANIGLKSTASSYPIVLHYDRAFPLGTLQFYPSPGSGLTLHMNVWSKLSSIALITDVLTLPPGYEAAYAYNLAVRLAPQYGKEASQTVQRMAFETKKRIEVANYQPIIGSNTIPVGHSNNGWNIYTL